MEEKNNNENFIHDIIDSDLAEGRVTKIHTRFPPEPNGCLHIGSAKAIWINFTTAQKYGGEFNLRYDDTNPVKENEDFVRSIHEDLTWLIGKEPDHVFYGSDYFDKCYEYAVKLIREGKAYVCDLTPEEMREYRGTLTKPGKNSPYRDRSVEENLELFENMKEGKYPDGAKVLRAKIDMSSPNMNMRDPAIYRIVHVNHHRQGNKWCIYPLYDYAHPIQDALEGISHSLCSLEFENHRPLYNWVVENIGFDPRPHQYEFARLNITHTVMSKRYLRELVETGMVDGWDDPRLPTLSALRRRGFSPSTIFEFIKRAGVSKANSLVDIEMLNSCAREELNKTALRRMAVTEPLKVIIRNFPKEQDVIWVEVSNNPEDPTQGTRKLPLTKNIYIEASDFAMVPPPKYQRLKPDGEVRLMGAFIIKCEEVILDEDGNPKELICSADLDTIGKNPADGRKVRGVVHWVSEEYAIERELHLYDHLFTIENVADMPEDKNFKDFLNPDALVVKKHAKLEPSLKDAKEGDRFQFVRMGYYCLDNKHENTFNRIIPLKDGYKKKK